MRSCGVAYDRIIDADRSVVGTLPCAGLGEVSGAPSIRIRWHAAIAAPDGEHPVWTRAPDGLWFDPPGVARYRCTTDTIDVTPIAGGASDMVDALLVATALPAVLWMNCAIVLHAAAVVPPGRRQALAFAGPSGCGKSRIAAALVTRGAALVADDSIAMRSVSGGPVCAGLAGGYHLGTSDDAARTFHAVDPDRARRSAPLGTIVILDDAPGRARLTGVDAVVALLANRHRARVPRLYGIEGALLGDLARLASAVRVYRWPVREADALLDDAVRARTLSNEGA